MRPEEKNLPGEERYLQGNRVKCKPAINDVPGPDFLCHSCFYGVGGLITTSLVISIIKCCSQENSCKVLTTHVCGGSACAHKGVQWFVEHVCESQKSIVQESSSAVFLIF